MRWGKASPARKTGKICYEEETDDKEKEFHDEMLKTKISIPLFGECSTKIRTQNMSENVKPN